jgi:hypothetical protein
MVTPIQNMSKGELRKVSKSFFIQAMFIKFNASFANKIKE